MLAHNTYCQIKYYAASISCSLFFFFFPFCRVYQLFKMVKDMLKPSKASEKRQHKLKR